MYVTLKCIYAQKKMYPTKPPFQFRGMNETQIKKEKKKDRTSIYIKRGKRENETLCMHQNNKKEKKSPKKERKIRNFYTNMSR